MDPLGFDTRDYLRAQCENPMIMMFGNRGLISLTFLMSSTALLHSVNLLAPMSLNSHLDFHRAALRRLLHAISRRHVWNLPNQCQKFIWENERMNLKRDTVLPLIRKVLVCRQ